MGIGTSGVTELAPEDDITWSGKQTFSGVVSYGSPVELTIASGVVTATQTYHIIDTQSDDSADDLDTINGGSDGDILILKSADGARDTTLKDGGGNLRLAGDFILAATTDRIMLISDGTNWNEISRSTNA